MGGPTKVIAIDGPAAAGKGTLARRLADRLGYGYLDTGLLYRAVGWAVLVAGGDPEDPRAAVTAATAVTASDLDRPELRTDEAALAASKVAAIPAVREALLEFQRSFARTPPPGKLGVVLDGRDIGTRVCPDADTKLFITASPEARAARRLKELQGRGVAAIHSCVLRDMQERDARDSSRASAPLRPAPDAIVIDTTDMDADAVLARVLETIGDAPTEHGG